MHGIHFTTLQCHVIRAKHSFNKETISITSMIAALDLREQNTNITAKYKEGRYLETAP